MAADQEVNINFVLEIEKYPCLYDYTLSEYMRKNITDKAWAQIGFKYKLTGPEAKEKWKNLRCVFVRHLKPPKSGSGTAHKKPYYLADYMQFTLPFIKIAGKPSGNIKEDSNTVEINIPPNTPSDEDGTELQSTTVLEQSNQSISEQQFSLPGTSTQSITQPKPLLTPSSSQSATGKKKRNKMKETEAEQEISGYFKMKKSKMMENCETTEYSNKMFLLSLVSDMNKMKDSERRLFKDAPVAS